MAIYQKKVGGGVPYARKEAYDYDGTHYEADLKNGDIVTILDGGVTEQGTFGDQDNFKIKTRNGEKKLAFNQKTKNVLIDEFGNDSENWIGKSVNVILKKDVIAGKKVIIPFLVTEGWQLDEYGELVKPGQVEDINSDDIPY